MQPIVVKPMRSLLKLLPHFAVVGVGRFCSLASQNYRNQQEITRKQRAEMGQQEAMTGAGTMEEAASKWKVGDTTGLGSRVPCRHPPRRWIEMFHLL